MLAVFSRSKATSCPHKIQSCISYEHSLSPHFLKVRYGGVDHSGMSTEAWSDLPSSHLSLNTQMVLNWPFIKRTDHFGKQEPVLGVSSCLTKHGRSTPQNHPASGFLGLGLSEFSPGKTLPSVARLSSSQSNWKMLRTDSVVVLYYQSRVERQWLQKETAEAQGNFLPMSCEPPAAPAVERTHALTRRCTYFNSGCRHKCAGHAFSQCKCYPDSFIRILKII